MKRTALKRKTPLKRKAIVRKQADKHKKSIDFAARYRQAQAGKEERTCLQCGKTYVFYLSQLKAYPNAGKYCSRACGYEYRRIQGKAKPITDKYGRTKRVDDIAWTKAVRERDNYTCQRCGVYQPYIHTHHVASRAQRPDLKWDVNNGKCLCNSCHSWAHNNPLEAQALGLISNARYELERLEQRHTCISETQRMEFNTELLREAVGQGVSARTIGSYFNTDKGPVLRAMRRAGIESLRMGVPAVDVAEQKRRFERLLEKYKAG